jgi:hypothetical protein
MSIQKLTFIKLKIQEKCAKIRHKKDTTFLLVDQDLTDNYFTILRAFYSKTITYIISVFPEKSFGLLGIFLYLKAKNFTVSGNTIKNHSITN